MKSNACETADCLILDIRMPKLGGLDVHKALKACGVSKPVFFISAHEESREQALNAGAAAFLSKPFEEKDLFHVLESIMR